MKIQVLSDLHIDSYAKRDMPLGRIPQTEAELILVAGDTANSDTGMSWLQHQADLNNKPILTIAGNHEYFTEDIYQFDKTLKSWDNFDDRSMTGLKFMQCNHYDIGDVRFHGCTLWTDYEFEATEETKSAVMAFMRDYRQITAGQSMFSPEVSVAIHYEHRKWLTSSLKQAYLEGKKSVVMTHHSVSPKSISARYSGMPSNAAFVTDLSKWMHEDWAPKLWVHGHTHEAFDYTEGNTRVVVNPRAYPGEISSTELTFNWEKVIDI